jgi:hypothetical protein
MDSSAVMEAPPPSSVTNEFISNKHALDQFLYQFFNKEFEYKIASEPKTITIIDALKMLRSKPFGFNFIDVIQTYIELLRKDDRIDDDLLHQLKMSIKDFKGVLEPWVGAQTVGQGVLLLSEKGRIKELPDSLTKDLQNKCENILRITTASENPSQNFMHEMVNKLCRFFKQRTDESMGLPGFDINKQVHLGSTLYFFLNHYDQLLLPILEQLKVENQTSEGKEIIKVFDPRNHAYVKGGRRSRHKRSGHTKRSGKSGHKRSGKRSGHKRSGHKSRRR